VGHRAGLRHADVALRDPHATLRLVSLGEDYVEAPVCPALALSAPTSKSSLPSCGRPRRSSSADVRPPHPRVRRLGASCDRPTTQVMGTVLFDYWGNGGYPSSPRSHW
jgi:hypothetical protein